MREPIAIVGTGCRFAGKVTSPSRLWDLLKEPEDLQSKIPDERFSADGFYNENHAYHGNSNVRHSYFLDENVREFDAQFFGIKPVEANAMDPQQRLLLEVVYEALEAGGHSISQLQGSNTAVYVGVMCGDYEAQLLRDTDSMPTYHATGIARSILSNRISYFFDWRGPSLTIDTACSSSLVALHQAVQVLRDGSSRVALAAGTNLILGPENYIGESKLKMLSPKGRSRMWDIEADGYARGEGVAAVVLKRLSDAIKDGDAIESVIRETGTNQDGRTRGITMPGVASQIQLIRDVYNRAGLNPYKASDRPQYYEAHGTGTPAGDPVEAEAISTAFFSTEHSAGTVDIGDPIYVGSLKTVFGHTEGAAGLAAVIKASLAVQHGVIPPNMLFNKLNPEIEPFYGRLIVPTTAQTWHEMAPGQPRRASVGNFGFGGANAHAIIESYHGLVTKDRRPSKELQCYVPFVFSANSRRSLIQLLSSYSAYLKKHRATNLEDLAWTLYARRSQLAVRLSLSAVNVDDLVEKLDATTAADRNSIGGEAVSISSPRPRVLGIFTGQGAQWAGMGRELIVSSEFAASRLRYLDSLLQLLPPVHRPTWSLSAKLVDKDSIQEAALSQPLCTAIQIIMVDFLKTVGIEFYAVVGHSSGEIAAAYAAGLISAEDACRISYYRGLHAAIACGEGGKPGKMMAVATSFQDAQELCNLPYFKGRICIAANNAPNSVTIAGDEDAILEAKVVFEDEEKSVKALFVDKAYHSHHMLKSSVAYAKDISSFKPAFSPVCNANSRWFSSVYGQEVSHIEEKLNETYWNQNMINTVLFSNAIETAWADAGPFDAAIEVGPHPALKRPVLESIKQVSAAGNLSYTGVLSRGQSDSLAFSNALGFLWTKLGTETIDLESYQKTVLGEHRHTLVTGLPTYPWDKGREYWHESRASKSFRTRKQPTHMLLGNRLPDSTDGSQHQWRNFLSVEEVPWLSGHKLQEQPVFPAAGYCVMALEASKTLFEVQTAQLIELCDITIHSALVFQEHDKPVETLFMLKNITRPSKHTILADWFLHASVGEYEDTLVQKASGSLKVNLGKPSPLILPGRIKPQLSMMGVDTEKFYASLSSAGYGYSGRFKALDNLSRRADRSSGTVLNPAESILDNLLVHPGALDAAIQAVILAFCYPYDGQLFAIHVPTQISSIKINPQLCSEIFSKESVMPFDATLTQRNRGMVGDVDVFGPSGEHGIIQLEGVRCVLFAEATATDDIKVFSSTAWGPLEPDCSSVCFDMRATPQQYNLARDLERVSLYYLNLWERQIPRDDPARTNGPYKGLFRFSSHIRGQVSSGRHKYAIPDWMNDGPGVIASIREKYPDSLDLTVVETVGQRIPDVVAGKTTILEHLFQDDLLTRYYSDALGFPAYTRYLARIMAQLSHRYPSMDIIEVGAGTGHATKQILNEVGHAFGSYTFTDLSSGFFDKAQKRFSMFSEKIKYQILNIEEDVTLQGYAPHSFNVVVASFVLHATRSLEKTLGNVRRLLKPGGYLVLLEMTDNDPIRNGFVFGSLPDWWAGEDDGRVLSPCVEPVIWDTILRETGFNGVYSITEDLDRLPFPASVIVSQACNDRINMLRDPIVELATYSRKLIGDELIIVGGSSLKTSTVIKNIQKYLAPYYSSVLVRKSFSDVLLNEVTPTTTVLSLSDIDQPIFAELTKRNWAGMKAAYENSRCIVWITSGTQGDNPHANMSIGFGRSILWEIPGLELQFIDIGKQPLRADDISNALLRFAQANEWERKNQLEELTYSIELELYTSETGYIIPRVKADEVKNNRFNSTRRRIIEYVDSSQFSLCAVEEKGALILEKGHALQEMRHEAHSSSSVMVNVQYSSLTPLRIGQGSALFVVIGFEVPGGSVIVGLSETVATSILISRGRTVTLGTRSSVAPDVLSDICIDTVCAAILDGVLADDTLIIHEPPFRLAEALLRRSSQLGAIVKFTTSRNLASTSVSKWISIPLNAPQRQLRGLLPRDALKFLNLASRPVDIEVGVAISKQLPRYCQQQNLANFFEQTARVSRHDTEEFLHRALLHSVEAGFKDKRPSGSDMPNVLRVGEVPEISEETKLSSIMDWTWAHNSSSVQAVTRPASNKPLFRRDRSYWLLGLTGDLGLSLAEFMVRLGARYIIFSSRNPKIDQTWLKAMSDMGCYVSVHSRYACRIILIAIDTLGHPLNLDSDIIDLSDLRRLYDDICQRLPPLAGVAHGGMVLQDTPIRDMNLETMNKVLGPKVQGSINLNEVMGNRELDFLIYFSSMTEVVGNMGQSNYTAANAFMTSLAQQRHKRGLSASVINIGAIIGVGYVSRETTDASQENLLKGGYFFLSESAFHEIFAEAVVAGRKSSGQNPEISTGLRHVKLTEDRLPIWVDNPRFSHHVIRSATSDLVSFTNGKSIPLKVQLQDAATEELVFKIVQDAFLAKLQNLLRIEFGNDRTEQEVLALRTDNIGIDSLVAVEVRTWFLKNLQVNVPVLKILGGASIGEIVQQAISQLSKDQTPNLGSIKMPMAPSKVPQPVPSPEDQNAVDRAPNGLVLYSSSESISSFGLSTVSITVDSDDAVIKEVMSVASISTDSVDTPLEISNDQEYSSVGIERAGPLSYGQSMFWFVNALVKDPTTLNHTGSFRMKGKIRVPDLARAVQEVGYRHESLRTCFYYEDQKIQLPLQGVLPRGTLQLEISNINGEDEVAGVFETLHKHVYDLSRGQVMRLILLTKSLTEHYFLIGAHHINVDGFTHQVLMKDLERAYNGKLPTKPLQYLDYSIRQREESLNGSWDGDLKYWAKTLENMPEILPILPLPDSQSRKVLADYNFHRLKLKLSSNLTAQINQTSRGMRSTPFHFYLAAFRVLLYILSGAEDFCVGIGDANRTSEDTLTGIGAFVNILPLLFTRHSERASFANILQDTRETVLDALSHSRVPFGAILENLSITRSEYHSPIFQTFVDYREVASGMTTFADTEMEMLDFESGRTAYDINVDIVNYAAGCQIEFMVQTSIYSENDVKALRGVYQRILELFSKTPTAPIVYANIYGEEKVQEALSLGRGPIMDSKWPETLIHRVIDISIANPQNLAIKDASGVTFTYQYMLNRVKIIAGMLINSGATFGSIIGVYQERAADLICCLLAVMYVGATYLPLDPGVPTERLTSIVADCKPSIILSDASTVGTVTGLNVREIRIVNCSAASSEPSHAVQVRARASGVGVIFYTSGTTGTPKGIPISHASLKNEVEFSAQTYGFGVERVLQQSLPSFDMSLTQTFAALAFGGYLYVCPSTLHADSVAQASIIASEQITLTGGTPSEYLSWIKAGAADLGLSPWRVAISGGEAIKDSLLEAFRSLQKEDLRLFNAYGPTEVTCSATRREVHYKDINFLEQSPITGGHAAPNSRFYIVNKFLQPVPVGFTGEVIVGGAGIALGYLNRAKETSAKFLKDRYATSDEHARGWVSMHRTGDLGKMMPDGSLLLLGRIEGDSQVKLRGIRVDLSEIECAISTIHGVTDVVVSCRQLGTDNVDCLVAHIVVSDIQLRSADRLRQAIDRLSIPRHMRPSIIILADDLPRGRTGKIDRSAVEQLTLVSEESSPGGTELTPKMEQMCQLWLEVIALEVFSRNGISSTTDFFHVGGNSLLLVDLQRRIYVRYGVRVSLLQLFESSTLERMTTLVNNAFDSKDTAIDWDIETEPVGVMTSADVRIPPSAAVIVITGATGHLGRELLRQLIENDRVREIHCIAVRQPERLHGLSSKVNIYTGDLSAPLLGMAPQVATTIFAKADVIIHNGANVSHLKHYRSLKADNVGSTRELVRLASPRRIPLHFVSTAGVALYSTSSGTDYASSPDTELTFGEVSVADFPPPTHGADGYTASKWASERLLERAHAQFKLPVMIHRPSNIAREDVPELDLFRNLLQFCGRIGAVPVSDQLQGFLNLVPVESCAQEILAEVLRSGDEKQEANELQFWHRIGDINLTFKGLRAYVAENTGRPLGDIAMVPLRMWTEMAVRAGMHPTVGSYFNAVESGGDVRYPRLVRNKT
ncbi:polyketide synthetase [Xylariaceae sp. FL1651]|nr:polyketide synthetase [Xylariaceae sp. FL1651]